MSTPASKHSLNSLVQNSQDTMAVLEKTFPAMMELRVRLTAIGADGIDKTESIMQWMNCGGKDAEMFRKLLFTGAKLHENLTISKRVQ